METIDRIFDPPASHYYLFGPRGTGKSTWIASNYPDALVIDLLYPDQFRRYKAYPERIRELILAENPTICVIDEVQKVPELLDVIHALIEDREIVTRFILTGSSSRKLRRQGVDLMAGRAVKRNMHPFVAAELGDRFDLSAALKYGLIPLIWDSADSADSLSGYIDLYIREEIKAEGLVRNLGEFTRFLEAISFSHGQVLNVTNVARECEVNRKTVEGFIEVLEDLYLAFKLQTFRKRAKRKVTKHPKFYFYDTGVYRALRPSGPLDSREELSGAGLEGLVAQHLRAWIDYRNKNEKLYFWRTRGGSEVDFVIYGDQIWAIEVKSSAKIHRKQLRHLKTFGEDYPKSNLICVYGGEEKRFIDDIICLPAGQFLKKLTPDFTPGSE